MDQSSWERLDRAISHADRFPSWLKGSPVNRREALRCSGGSVLDLGELKKLAEAATKGPWDVEEKFGGDTHWIDVVSDNCPHSQDLGADEVACAEPQPRRQIVHKNYWEKHDEIVAQIRADMTFIAAARTAVPELIAEVEALRAEREAVD